MKTNVRNYLLSVLAILPFLLVSCEDGFLGGISGEGEIVEGTLDVDEFDGFDLGIAADVYVSQGDEFGVVMEAQQNIIDNINTDNVSNGIWKIKNYTWVRNSKSIKIFITLPELTKVSLSGSGDIVGETPFTDIDRLDVSISGSGKIDLETESSELFLKISGSGDIYLTGSTDLLDCSISGSGGIHAFDMITNRADIIVSGSGNTRVNVEEALDVSISGSGSVYYRGNPQVDSHISGSGNVRHDQ